MEQLFSGSGLHMVQGWEPWEKKNRSEIHIYSGLLPGVFQTTAQGSRTQTKAGGKGGGASERPTGLRLAGQHTREEEAAQSRNAHWATGVSGCRWSCMHAGWSAQALERVGAGGWIPNRLQRSHSSGHIDVFRGHSAENLMTTLDIPQRSRKGHTWPWRGAALDALLGPQRPTFRSYQADPA